MVDLNSQILQITGASRVNDIKSVQTLWSGYGEIKRYQLEGGRFRSVIAKHIQLSDNINQPKGWNTPLSHQRKLKSYQVERRWYQQYSELTDKQCKIPKCYHVVEENSEILLIMEDLDASGFNIRLMPEQVSLENAKSCLIWLAHFHAKFMGAEPEGLWPVGTYWHLETRPEEFEKMQNIPLKHAAHAIDERLQNAEYQTIIHGDAKLANFCFGEKGPVAAVDFQYVGKGCGIKDVAYFISSCFDEEECQERGDELLGYYFNQLQEALDDKVDFESVKEEWSTLYRYAWADFYRFLDGWSPGHWKMHTYSRNMTKQVLNELKLDDAFN